jgi:hypothetical protein
LGWGAVASAWAFILNLNTRKKMNTIKLNTIGLNDVSLNYVGAKVRANSGGGGGNANYAIPFYIEAIQSARVRLTNTHEYSKDGETWTTADSTYISIGAGERLYYRAKDVFLGKINSTNTIRTGGNIMSLLYGADFQNKTELVGTWSFASLFDGATKLVDASELILPATTLTDYCYDRMFQGCKSLVNAPELPATTLADNCYSSMFNGCASLQYVKAMFITTPSSNYTGNWLFNVAAGGIFVKNATATWNVTGDNGIPSSWTIETAEA